MNVNEKVTTRMKWISLRQDERVENHLYVHSRDNMAAPTSDLTAVWTYSEHNNSVIKKKY